MRRCQGRNTGLGNLVDNGGRENNVNQNDVILADTNTKNGITNTNKKQDGEKKLIKDRE